MSVQIITQPNALVVEIRVGRQVVRLDFSKQRHYYPNLDGAKAKPQNSILYRALSIGNLVTELTELGGRVAARMEAPKGRSRRQAVASSKLHDDYRLLRGRTWRVDNVAMDPDRPPNHCYPIAGPQVWDRVSQSEFAAAAALRRLEVELEARHVRDSVSNKWRSMQHMSPGQQNGNSLFRALSGARTHMRNQNLPTRKNLATVSGCGRLLHDLVATLP